MKKKLLSLTALALCVLVLLGTCTGLAATVTKWCDIHTAKQCYLSTGTLCPSYLQLLTDDADTGEFASIALEPGHVQVVEDDFGKSYIVTSFGRIIPVLNQLDPEWCQKKYSTSTLGKTGCSVINVTSMLCAYGIHIDPGTLVDWMGIFTIPDYMSKDEHDSGRKVSETSWGVVEYTLKAFGIPASERSGSASIESFDSALERGQLIIALMEEGSGYSKGRHFVVITGRNESNKYQLMQSIPGYKDAGPDWHVVRNVVNYIVVGEILT